MEINHSHIVLDACCVLNLCASDHFIDILKVIPVQFVVTQVVHEQELKTLRQIDDTNNEGAIQYEQAITQNLLKIVDFDSEEESGIFIDFVFEIKGDGELATGAIGIHRGWAIATDDRRAIAFFRREVPNLTILSTLEIIKYWSEEAQINSIQLQIVLNNIQIQGRYAPQKSHPLRSWWEKAICEI
ncbi:MAG: hypothetical protein WBA13_11310 [Microcoleaceae cyanobacterium]